MVDQGSAVFRTVVGMNSQSRPLIHQQNVLIFVNNGQFRHSYRQVSVVFSGLVKKFVVDIQLQDIAFTQPCVPFHTLAVAFDPLDADILLSQRRGEQRHSLC